MSFNAIREKLNLVVYLDDLEVWAKILQDCVIHFQKIMLMALKF